MKIYKTSKDIKEAIELWKSDNADKKIGFVATMGALHAGHMALINEANRMCGLVVASIFVNPTQFNDPADLERYPRTETEDAKLLEDNKCDILFLPAVDEVYVPKQQPYDIDLQGLDNDLEGKYRPGHFKGVCNVVEKLLNIIAPDISFFGIKDFQQVAIVKYMVKLRKLPVEIIAVPILRNEGGLALSSRNALLSEKEKEDARIINWTLRLGKQLVGEGHNLKDVKENMLAFFDLGKLSLEYLEIVDNLTLKKVTRIQPEISVCIAAYCGKVRLIDNMQLN